MFTHWQDQSGPGTLSMYYSNKPSVLRSNVSCILAPKEATCCPKENTVYNKTALSLLSRDGRLQALTDNAVFDLFMRVSAREGCAMRGDHRLSACRHAHADTHLCCFNVVGNFYTSSTSNREDPDSVGAFKREVEHVCTSNARGDTVQIC